MPVLPVVKVTRAWSTGSTSRGSRSSLDMVGSSRSPSSMWRGVETSAGRRYWGGRGGRDGGREGREGREGGREGREGGREGGMRGRDGGGREGGVSSSSMCIGSNDYCW